MIHKTEEQRSRLLAPQKLWSTNAKIINNDQTTRYLAPNASKCILDFVYFGVILFVSNWFKIQQMSKTIHSNSHMIIILCLRKVKSSKIRSNETRFKKNVI